MELAYGKLLAALLMFVATLISSLLPILIVKKPENEGGRARNFRVVSFLSCFGGGVFMATCLLHLLPDVQDQMVMIFKNLNLNPNFPVAEFLMSVGFLIVLIIEQIVLNCQRNDGHENISILSHQHSHSEPLYQNYGSVTENLGKKMDNNHQHSHAESQYQNYASVTENLDQRTNSSHQHSHADPFYQNYGSIAESLDQRTNNDDFVPCVPSTVPPHENENLHPHEVSFHQDLSSHSILRSLLLVFALSLHSVFEGLAIGLQSSIENVIRILLAVLIHKCIIAFTLGLNLSHSKLDKSGAIKGIVFFSLTSPIGIIIGLVVVDFVTGMPMMITSGVLQGLAAGTFLYVTFFEVLPHELNSNENRMIKMGCLVLGFSVVSVLLILLPD